MKTLIFSALLLAVSLNVQAGVPVLPTFDQQLLLKSNDPKLATNKQLVYDFFRIVLYGLHLDQAKDFLRTDYIQHNPSVETGLQGFLDAFSKLGPPRPIEKFVPGLVQIQAEGNFVTLSFVDERPDPKNQGAKYTTTWFDMFRIQDGKIAEHWDNDIKPAN